MLAQITLAVLSLSTAAAAWSPPALKNIRAEPVVVEVRQAETTGTATESAGVLECASSALNIITDAPEPPAALQSYIVSFASTADPNDASALCQITKDMPASLTSAYSSYNSAASSWLVQHSSEIDAFGSKCGDAEGAATAQGIFSSLDSYASGVCAGATDASPTAAGASSSVSTGLAARPTGMVAGAVAAAGLFGVAAVL
ncbi:hypothetical protein F4677DRAFT_401947 [Hypoxylon crocopeplum]|nr:hypothetical protein F4677DRAFT_401947 [Hypoxylon crocopeplum]